MKIFTNFFSLSSLAFWDCVNEILLYIMDKLERCGGFVGGTTNRISLVEVVAWKIRILKIKT